MRRIKIVRPKCEVKFALAEVIRLRMVLKPSEFQLKFPDLAL